ncbi:unnamed protein product [Colias eurytheme]|nr:unnamed protein product [Colias eurytheme]
MLSTLIFFVIIHRAVNQEENSEKLLKNLQKEWHVSSLNDPEFNEDVCQSVEPVKFKKQKDAGKIEFVSSDPIPSNVSELIQFKCEIDKKIEERIAQNKMSKTTARVPQIINLKNENLSMESASTAKMDIGGTQKDARRNDYQFSSVEYYDELPDFDESQCPGDVEMVVLELDELRSYDLECEMISEWRSLD